jgi:hypothetical protein
LLFCFYFSLNKALLIYLRPSCYRLCDLISLTDYEPNAQQYFQLLSNFQLLLYFLIV